MSIKVGDKVRYNPAKHSISGLTAGRVYTVVKLKHRKFNADCALIWDNKDAIFDVLNLSGELRGDFELVTEEDNNMEITENSTIKELMQAIDKLEGFDGLWSPKIRLYGDGSGRVIWGDNKRYISFDDIEDMGELLDKHKAEPTKVITIDGKDIEISKESFEALKSQLLEG